MSLCHASFNMISLLVRLYPLKCAWHRKQCEDVLKASFREELRPLAQAALTLPLLESAGVRHVITGSC